MAVEIPRRTRLLAALLLLVTSVGRGADVLQHVPGDAFGFVIVKKIGGTDTKATQLFGALQLPIAGPLGFLKAISGATDGLAADGDFLLAILPGAAGDLPPSFAVWIPTSDYDRLIRGLGGDPGQQISSVTVGGENVLVAHQEDWALVMDPDGRARMEQLLAPNPMVPPPIADWKSWIDSNDATAIALTPGVRTVLMSGRRAPSQLRIRPQSGGDDLFGGAPSEEGQPAPTLEGGADRPGDILGTVRVAIQKWARSSRKLYNLALHSSAAGCGMRLDGTGNAQVGIRLAFDETFKVATGDAGRENKNIELPALVAGSDFVVSGAGYLPGAIAVALASGHVQQQITDLESTERIRFGEEAVARMLHAVEVAAADVNSAALLTKLGAKEEGVYTNSFIAVHVSSAATFVDHIQEVMRLWNKMNADVQGETHFVFDVEEVKLGDHAATQYSVDLALVDGGPALPEVRQANEKFFGPGGKLRLFIASMGDKDVLLAMATPEQATAAVKALDEHQKPPADSDVKGPAYQLLPDKSDWKIYFDAHRYSQWLSREQDATVGVPVIGGPLVKEFPASPPLAAAGGFREREAWVEIAVPAETIKSAGTFLKK